MCPDSWSRSSAGLETLTSAPQNDSHELGRWLLAKRLSSTRGVVVLSTKRALVAKSLASAAVLVNELPVTVTASAAMEEAWVL